MITHTNNSNNDNSLMKKHTNDSNNDNSLMITKY